MEVSAGMLFNSETRTALPSVIDLIKVEVSRPWGEKITSEWLAGKLGLDPSVVYACLGKLLGKGYLEKDENGSPPVWTQTMLFRASHSSLILEDLDGKKVVLHEDTDSSLPSRVAPRPGGVKRGSLIILPKAPDTIPPPVSHPEAMAGNSDLQEGGASMDLKKTKRGMGAINTVTSVRMLLRKKKGITINDVATRTDLSLPTIFLYMEKMVRLGYLTVEKKKRPFVWSGTGKLEKEDIGEIGARLFSSNSSGAKDHERETHSRSVKTNKKPQKKMADSHADGEWLVAANRALGLINQGADTTKKGVTLLRKEFPRIGRLIKAWKALKKIL